MRRSSYLQIVAAFFVLAIVLTTLAYSRQASEPANNSKHPIAEKLPARGIPNFGQVSPTLFRGAQPSPEGIETLKKMGVDIVVDLRGVPSSEEAAKAAKLGMQYVSIPSHCPFPTDAPWARFLAVIRENPQKKVFVHCRLGEDRTGMAVASYRMAVEGWNAKEALNEMNAFGFRGVHHAMCPGLEDYELDFPKRLKSNAAFEKVRPPEGGPVQ